MHSPILTSLLRENPIVITGTGCYSAGGNSVSALWKSAVHGKPTAAWREFENGNGSERFAVCSAPEILPSHPKLHPVRKTDRSIQMAWLAAQQAWRQADLSGAYLMERVGIAAGSSRGPVEKVKKSFGVFGPSRYPPSLGASSTFGAMSGALAQAFRIRGPGATLSATCASAAFAIAFAAEQILLGKADAMIALGADAPLHPAILAQLQAAGVLGFHEEATHTCRPFDRQRNGLVLGEGSGALILESARSAERRGAEPLAKLAGWSIRLNDSGRTGVDPDGAGLLEVMREALCMSNRNVDEIDYINAHGTGTRMNDEAEARAVRQFFGGKADMLSCSSTKPVTGHCLGATPALEAVIAIEALRNQQTPPTATCFESDPLCQINPQPRFASPKKISAVLSNSLGFWGYHASLVFAKA